MLSYANVPKDLNHNLVWRLYLRNCLRDKAMRRVIHEVCKRDILFYVNSFVWTYDPRLKVRCIPFITYPKQDEFFLFVENQYRITEEDGTPGDFGVLKSRGVGASWSLMAYIDHKMRFFDDTSFLGMSRKEELVDNPDDPSSLMFKLNFIDERLPPWMRADWSARDRVHMRARYPKTRSIMTGETANENAGSGGRYSAALRDEEAKAPFGTHISRSLSHTTKMQMRVSTPNGVGNSYHAAWVKKSIPWFIYHWTDHPPYNRGLYEFEPKTGEITVHDKEWHEKYEKEHGEPYPFRSEPTDSDPGMPWEFMRSPWFDAEEDRADSRADIAQEIQCSFLGSGSPFFDAGKLASRREQCAAPPLWQGQIGELLDVHGIYDADQRPNRCKLWMQVGSQGMPPQMTTYSIGVDISAGTGASDSAISVADDRTKEKLMEFKSSGVTPEDLATLTTYLCEWLTTSEGRPYLAWDGGGHGGPYGTAIVRNGYHPVYYHIKEVDDVPHEASRPGVPTNREIKIQMLSDYRSALFSGEYVTYSEETYAQCEQFVFDGKGGVCHQKSKSTENNSERGEQHGDVVSSEAILWLAMRSRPEPEPQKFKAPPGSLAERMERRRKAEKNKNKVWVE